MTGAVIYNINSGWVPPVDYVLEVYDDTSPAVMYAGHYLDAAERLYHHRRR